MAKPRLLPPRWIANHCSEIADDKRGPMAQILERAKLPQHNAVADMEIGRGWICSKFCYERFIFRAREFYFFREFILANQIDSAAPDGVHLFVEWWEGH